MSRPRRAPIALNTEDEDPFGDSASDPAMAADTAAAVPEYRRTPPPLASATDGLLFSPPSAAPANALEATPASVTGFGDDGAIPLDARASPATAGALVLSALRVVLVKGMLPTYRIYTAGSILGGARTERTVTRTLPQLIACRAQLIEKCPCSLVPSLPPDGSATEYRGRDMVMTFVHILAANPTTAVQPLVHLLLGHTAGDSPEETDKIAKSTFELRARDVFGGHGAMTKAPSSFDNPMPKLDVAPVVDEWQCTAHLFSTVDRCSSCLVRVKRLEEGREDARRCAEAWSKACQAALVVRDETAGVAGAMSALAPALVAHADCMFWPWTKSLVLQGAAHTASTLAFKAQAAKVAGGPSPPPGRMQPHEYDHNVNAEVDHPTIRLRRYIQRTANLMTSIADTGVGQSTVSPALYRSTVVATDERVAESMAAAVAIGQLCDMDGIRTLPKCAKKLADLAKSPGSTKPAFEAKLNAIDADVTAAWAKVRFSASGFHEQLNHVRYSTRVMLTTAIRETAKAEHACLQASLIIAEDLLQLICEDPFVDDEDRPFRDPLALPPEALEPSWREQAAEQQSVPEYGPLSMDPDTDSLAAANAHCAASASKPPPAAASRSTPPPPPVAGNSRAASQPDRGQKLRREAIRLHEDHDPFHPGAEDASPTGREMDEVFESHRRGVGRPSTGSTVGVDGWARRRAATDEFGERSPV